MSQWRAIGLIMVVFFFASSLVCGGEKRNLLPEPPRVFCLNPQALLKAKTRLTSGDQALQPALNKLRREAEKALKAGPFSVMDKTLVPSSGDKHDYLSFAPYWWPDPKKKDGLPYVQRDGETNPESKNSGSDSPTLGRMVSSVETLALAYYLTGEESYAEKAAGLLRGWFLDPTTRMNPHLNYGQVIPGRVEGRGSGIIDTRHLTQIVDAIGLLASSKAWSGKDQEGMVTWFKAYLEWLLTSKHGQEESRAANNHGTWYDVQVVSFALFGGKNELARQVIEASKQRRIASQIEPDGRQPQELKRTKSLDYSIMNLYGMFELAGLGERVGVDLWYYQSKDGRGIHKALDFLAPYADPEKKWPYQQIQPSTGYSRDLSTLFRRGAIAYRNERYEELIDKLLGQDAVTHRLQLLYPK